MAGPEGMDKLAEVAGSLKRRLVEYYRKQGYSGRAMREYRRGRAERGEVDEVECADWFIHHYRFRNGDTMIDRFMKANPGLSEIERGLLELWKEAVVGIFEVRGRGGGVMELFNLVDRETYVVASTLGPEVLERFPVGSFVLARLEPAGKIHFLSGKQWLFPPEQRDAVEETARKMAVSSPRVALGRNRERWERAWAVQKRLYEAFVEYFGSDVVVVPPGAVADTFGSFLEWWNRRVLEGMSAEERQWALSQGIRPPTKVPEGLLRCETVGIVMDAEEGLNFYAELGRFLEVFARPESFSAGERRDIVMRYLWSDSISPLPFRKVVERYPENARLVFGEIFARASWDNERDLGSLMRKYKARFLKRRPQPWIIPVATQILAGGAGEASRPGAGPGAARPG